MDARTEGTTRKPRGRKDADKQEATIKTAPVKDRISELVRLYKAAAEAAEDLNSAVKKAAEDSGMNASAVRKFVNARASEKFEEKKRDCEQLGLLFEEVGE